MGGEGREERRMSSAIETEMLYVCASVADEDGVGMGVKRTGDVWERRIEDEPSPMGWACRFACRRRAVARRGRTSLGGERKRARECLASGRARFCWSLRSLYFSETLHVRAPGGAKI